MLPRTLFTVKNYLNNFQVFKINPELSLKYRKINGNVTSFFAPYIQVETQIHRQQLQDNKEKVQLYSPWNQELHEAKKNLCVLCVLCDLCENSFCCIAGFRGQISGNRRIHLQLVSIQINSQSNAK
jgi:hypothetical protein